MKIIAVDDEEIALKNLELKLKECPEVSEYFLFTDPISALDRLKANSADVALLDIRMRQKNGLELAKEIRELAPDCSVVFITGYSQYAVEAFAEKAVGYLLKPIETAELRRELTYIASHMPLPKAEQKRVRIQCFGNFEAFADGEPIKFERSKTKELLAYLVDRKGAAVTTGELCAVLWEGAADSKALRTRLRIHISDLTRSLKAIGCENIFYKRRNSSAIIPDETDCDYYSFIAKDAAAVNAYKGEYMAQYSWAEMTLGVLA